MTKTKKYSTEEKKKRKNSMLGLNIVYVFTPKYHKLL